MEYLSKTYRLDEQVVDAIERAKSGGTSANRFFRLLMGLDNGVSGGDGAPESLETVAPVVPATAERVEKYDPAAIAGVTRGPAPHSTVRTRCEHCGKNFDSESRKNKRCPECVEAGHGLSRYDCEECRLRD